METARTFFLCQRFGLALKIRATRKPKKMAAAIPPAVADGAFRRTYFLVRHRSKYLTDGMQRALQVVREEIAAQ